MPFDCIVFSTAHKRLPKAICQGVLSLVVTLVLLSHYTRGDVIVVGDVDPNGLNDDGTGAAGADLIIGNTDVGGLFMDIAPPLSGPLQVLSSDTGIIGNQGNSVGAAVFDDFGVRWEIDSSLTVGNFGQGFLDVFESAAIQVGGPLPSTAPTIIGDGSTGQGIMRLNGVASRLTTGPLTVGDEGVGTLEATGSASFVSADAIIGSQDGSIGTVTLTDLGSRWTVGDPNNIASLIIGNGGTGTPTNAYGTLNINTDALVQTSGVVTVNETGVVNLGGGTLRDIGGSILSNGGVIRGDGFLNTAMTITASGELRNAASVANQRERMLVTGAVIVGGDSDPNFEAEIDGLIESQGGEMEFHDLVTNNGGIVARDAILRFRGQEVSGATTDLDNNGLLVLGENSTVYGTIDNTGGLIVDVTGAAVAFPSVFGDVIFTQAPLVAAITGGGETAAISADTAILKLIVDEDPGALSIFGNLVLDGAAIFELDYVSSEPAQPGDSFSVVSASSITGNFGNSQVVANGRFWDVDVLGDEVMVTATALTVGTADFNSDGRVDGLDFLEWQTGYPSLYDLDDLARYEAAYGQSTTPPPVATVAAVPEPSTLLLALSTLGLCSRRRNRS